MERPDRSPIEIPEILKNYVKDKVFCEIGCGEGDLLRIFAKYAKKAYGIERTPEYFPALDKLDDEMDNVEIIKKYVEIYPKDHPYYAGGDLKIEDIPKADVYYFWISEGADEILLDKLPESTMIIHKEGFKKNWLENTFEKHHGKIEYINFTSKEECSYGDGWVFDENTPMVLGLLHKKKPDNVKFKFVVLGWYYEKYPDLINGLVELQKENKEFIDVFYACHKEPPQIIKDNFEWQLFENKGLEWGGYQQAYEHLNFDDNDILFFINDDLLIKDWNFLNVCLEKLRYHRVVGNGSNYGFYLDPQEFISPGNKDYPEDIMPWANKTKWIDEIRDENKYIFDEPFSHKTIRGSFLCIEASTLKDIGGFEVAKCPYEHLDKSQAWGNISLNMFGYKVAKLFGNDSITYLSDEYANSKYIFEYTRGE